MAYVGRFSDRVDDYARHRPTYPASVLELLARHGLAPGASVLDAGSGTGNLTELLLDRRATVYAVEPNEAMRLQAERRLSHIENFHSLANTAEDTGLIGASIDLITAAQSFHWFDVEAVCQEWRRILKPSGWVALMWNERRDDSEFSRGYGALARAFVDGQESARGRLVEPAQRRDQLFQGPYQELEFAHEQLHDLEGLMGRALSSSYWPRSGPEFESSMQQLEVLFYEHQVNGQVKFDYVTEVYLGQLA